MHFVISLLRMIYVLSINTKNEAVRVTEVNHKHVIPYHSRAVDCNEDPRPTDNPTVSTALTAALASHGCTSVSH